MNSKSNSKNKNRKGNTHAPRTRGMGNGHNVFPIVGVGASAGGLEAFERLLRRLPPSSGMAFVLVQHLEPKHESRLTEILSRATTMPVTEVKDGMRVRPNNVYVIPPNTNMRLGDKRLHLQRRDDPVERHLPIDIFFRSLANVQRNRAIGVILSGTASDGVAGMKAIKAQGGITFAQDAASAKYSGMPHASAAAGAVDFVLPPEEIAKYLARIGAHPYVSLPEVEDATEPAEPREGEESLNHLFRLLKRNFGVDFSVYKYSTINRRIKRRMALHTLDNIKDYVRLAKSSAEELQGLYQDMFIGITGFFREPESFLALKKHVFPKLVKQRPHNLPLRIWVPGCSTGEEVYSLAISLLEYLGDKAANFPIQIFGTDINDEAIKKARQGKYLEDIAPDVGRSRLRRFFIKVPEGYQLSKTVRDLCVFAKHDLVKDPPFSRLDLLSCRNVLIYLGAGLHQKLVPLFHYTLKSGGYLLLGSAESIGGFSDLFAVVDRKHKVFAKKAATLRPEVRFDFRTEYASEPVEVAAPPRGGPARGNFEAQKEAADLMILNQYAPAAVLVNENLDVLHIRGRTGHFLEPAPGVASLNLLKMAREGLMVGLRNAVNAARKKNAPAEVRGLQVDSDGGQKPVDLHVLPVNVPGVKGRTFLVLFDEQTRLGAESARGVARPGRIVPLRENEKRVAQLRHELGSTKAYLQSVIENQEASNEELRSLNEEIMSTNEELQSTTEELETANEELQSANEELTTLNEELQNRNQELSMVNNDILNVLESTNMCLVILDRELRIRRFTPLAQKVFNLIPSDVGRPINDIRLNLEIQDLDAILNETLETVSTVQREIRDKQGRSWALQVRPYLTSEKKIDGAVISLVDITELKQAAMLEERNRLAREIHDTLAQGFAGVLIQLEAAEAALVDRPEIARGHMLRASALARESLAEARRSVWELRPADSSVIGAAGAMKRLAAMLFTGTQTQVEFSVQGEVVMLPEPVEQTVLRIAQEAVVNAAKHSQARRVLIEFKYGAEEVQLTVRDDGVGYDGSKTSPFGLGLLGMQERATQIGGRLEVKSEPKEGTSVTLRVPRNAEGAKDEEA